MVNEYEIKKQICDIGRRIYEKEVYGNEVRKLRDSMGMNRKKFCDYYGIPYRTVQDWEAGKRKMPSYVLRMMKYVAEKEQMIRVS